MHPKRYIIKVRGITLTQAAQELGYTRQHLTQVLNLKEVPGINLCEKIAAWAKGHISFSEMIALRRKAQKLS